MKNRSNLPLFFVMAALFLAFATGIANAQFIDRPSEYSSSCDFPYSNPTYAYDGNPATYSYGEVSENNGVENACETWYGFKSESGTDMVLCILNSASTSSSGGTPVATLSYSLDGGSSFTDIYSIGKGSISETTSAVSLSNTQDLTKVQVKGEVAVAGVDGYGAGADQAIYEIWITDSSSECQTTELRHSAVRVAPRRIQ
jgi:hypothetical protein